MKLIWLYQGTWFAYFPQVTVRGKTVIDSTAAA